MPERVVPGPVEGPDGIREAVCIHTKKIYDSCRDKDCIENLRFYPKLQCADVVNRALAVKGGTARLLHIYVDVEPVSFNRGFYTVDLRFFYCVTLQAYLSSPIPVPVEGLCVFDKRVILFGSEGNAKIFSSQFRENGPDPQLLRKTNLPTAVAEAMADKPVLCAGKNGEIWGIPGFCRIVKHIGQRTQKEIASQEASWESCWNGGYGWQAAFRSPQGSKSCG
ncbi:MAG: hypothetical protein SOX55_08135, partial [Dysosmobacter sp.]|nr:hypothetical protein [Dysosmobacter sp.]